MLGTYNEIEDLKDDHHDSHNDDQADRDYAPCVAAWIYNEQLARDSGAL